MQLPAWARTTHPIVQRELLAWGKYKIPLRIVFGIFAILRTLEVFVTVVYSFPLSTRSFWILIPGLFALLGDMVIAAVCLTIGAVAVTREYESKIWDELRLTGLSHAEILAAKAVAGVRLVWPVVVYWIGTQVVTTLGLLAKWLYYGLFSYPIPYFDLLILAYVPVLALAAAAPLVVMVYYLNTGLFLSTLSRTQAKAILGSLALLCTSTACGAVSYLLGEGMTLTAAIEWLPDLLSDELIWAVVVYRPVIYNLIPHALMIGLSVVFFTLSVRRLAGEPRPIF